MGIFEGHLIASDIDGTLLDNGFLPPENVDAIRYFLSEGGAFSLATGRTVGAIGMALDPLGDISPCIMANGSIIYDNTAKKPLHYEVLPDSEKYIAKKIFDAFPDVGIQVHSLERVLILRRTRQVEDHDSYEGITNEDITFEEALSLPWNEVLYLFNSEEQRVEGNAFVDGLHSICHIVNTSAVVYGEKRYFLQQNPPNVSKATALKKLCELLGIKQGCCYAIGDYYNDLPMFGVADICAVPEGAPEDIKAAADVVVKSAKCGAVADFIEYLKNSVKADLK